jgi:DNA-binding transcriptional MerR regulator
VRSSDLARLAGVSVRTLRHYHQIGLVPEPPRSTNGYREYTAADLLRVLRVRRMADLGVPLGRIDTQMDVEEELALLDARYAEQIVELHARREAIRGLRGQGPRADTPTYAHAYIAALSEREDVPSESVEAERDAAVVLELFLAGRSSAGEAILPGREVPQVVDAAAVLLGLTEDTSGAEIEEAVDALAEAIGGLRQFFVPAQLTREAGESLELHVRQQLNSIQLSVVRRALECGPR